jgi:hypothetical protein
LSEFFLKNLFVAKSLSAFFSIVGHLDFVPFGNFICDCRRIEIHVTETKSNYARVEGEKKSVEVTTPVELLPRFLLLSIRFIEARRIQSSAIPNRSGQKEGKNHQ